MRSLSTRFIVTAVIAVAISFSLFIGLVYNRLEHSLATQSRALERISSEMSQQAQAGVSNEQVLALDRDFHNLIARASGNRVLAAVSRDIREVLSTLWALSLLDSPSLVEVAAQHARIAAAITCRDGAAAAAAMHDHLDWARAKDLTLMNDQA